MEDGKVSPRAAFEHKLDEVQQNVLRMGSEVEGMLNKSMLAYTQRSAALIDEVMHDDDIVDSYNLSIETECLNLLALQNPMARDLRIIAAALKIITDVERIGDYCIDIAKTAARQLDRAPLPPSPNLARMNELAKVMLRETLQAFVNHDLNLVEQMIQHDDEVDQLYRTTFDSMVELVQQDSSVAHQAIAAIMVARYLERIADHVTNVGERVYYMETGDRKELHQ